MVFFLFSFWPVQDALLKETSMINFINVLVLGSISFLVPLQVWCGSCFLRICEDGISPAGLVVDRSSEGMEEGSPLVTRNSRRL